jgi:hypothetical protein
MLRAMAPLPSGDATDAAAPVLVLGLVAAPGAPADVAGWLGDELARRRSRAAGRVQHRPDRAAPAAPPA